MRVEGDDEVVFPSEGGIVAEEPEGLSGGITTAAMRGEAQGMDVPVLTVLRMKFALDFLREDRVGGTEIDVILDENTNLVYTLSIPKELAEALTGRK